MADELKSAPVPEEQPKPSPSPMFVDAPVALEPEDLLVGIEMPKEEPEVVPLFTLEPEAPTPEPPAEPKPKKPKATFASAFVEFAEVLVSAVVAAILVLTLICRTGVVEGSSMVPTMHNGDRYIISDLFYTPEQGDIVVFRPDIEGKEELWIKRIIAVAGQKVYIDPQEFKVYVDDVLLDEPYLSEFTGTINHGTENPIIVPEDCVYVLGDNRSVSHDSRYADLGCVPVRMLAGRVIVRFWPLSDFQFYG